MTRQSQEKKRQSQDKTITPKTRQRQDKDNLTLHNTPRSTRQSQDKKKTRQRQDKDKTRPNRFFQSVVDIDTTGVFVLVAATLRPLINRPKR